MSLFIFQLLCECHCWWTKESPRVYYAKFYDRLRLIRSVLRSSKFSVLKLTEIVSFFLFYFFFFWGGGLHVRHPGLALFRHPFLSSRLRFWPRITDEGLFPDMSIWSVLSIKSDLKCWKCFRSLFSYYVEEEVCAGLHVYVWIYANHKHDQEKSVLHICTTIHIYALTVACTQIGVIRYGIMLSKRSYKHYGNTFWFINSACIYTPDLQVKELFVYICFRLSKGYNMYIDLKQYWKFNDVRKSLCIVTINGMICCYCPPLYKEVASFA